MATTEISVSVDPAMLDEVKRLAGADINVSAVVADALALAILRLRTMVTLREWERERTAP